MNRFDKELHKRGLAKSRTAASELICGGDVSVNGTVCTKPSFLVSPDDVLVIAGGAGRKYVSRGGIKLEHAFTAFGIDVSGRVCLDVGASTGGFTDCMLQYGAKHVYAVDVGTAQLDVSLRRDSRVTSVEQCDIREADLLLFGDIDFFTVDVSFISVKLILPSLYGLKAEGVVLVKPQFETGRRHKGVITSEKVRDGIAADIAAFAEGLGFSVAGTVKSPVTGKSGNVEYLLRLGVE